MNTDESVGFILVSDNMDNMDNMDKRPPRRVTGLRSASGLGGLPLDL